MTADLASVARALGGDVARGRGGEQVLAPGIGHSASDRSVWIRFGPQYPEHFWVTCFGRGDALAERARVRHLLRGSALSPVAEAAPRQAVRKADKNALWLFDESRHPANTRVEQYFTYRGLELPREAAGEAIRYHPNCYFDGEKVPAMISLVRDIRTNEPMAVHRTALSWGGTNYDVHGKGRMALGPIAGGAVKLTPDEEVTTCIGIGEGLESTVSLQLTEYGRSPVWALLNAAGIAAFPVLAGIECLWISVDHDPAGVAAAETCCRRWQRAGRQVFLLKANVAGADLNDSVRGARHAGPH